MPVNWGAFKSDLTSYYAGKSAANEAAAAQKIANMYDAAAKTAKVNLTQCKLIDNGNKDRFYPVILQGFISAKSISQGSAASAISAAWNNAIIAYWTGAIIASNYSGLPPGLSTLGLPIVVTSPGVCNFIMPSGGVPPSAMPNAMAQAFKAHLLTITGVYAAITSGSSPVPIPIPWTGMS